MATVPELPGCMSDGATRAEALQGPTYPLSLRRHCERSEAIQRRAEAHWIASSPRSRNDNLIARGRCQVKWGQSLVTVPIDCPLFSHLDDGVVAVGGVGVVRRTGR